MLSIFLCAYWPFVYLPWRNAYSDPLPVKFCFMFIFERQWDRAEEGQREEETHNLKQAPGSEQVFSTEPDAGLKPMNREIMRSWTLNQLNYPGTPSRGLLKVDPRGAWVAQSVKHLASAQVMISRFVGLSPTSGSVLTAQSLEPVSDSVSPSLFAPSLLALCLSLFQK